MNYSEIIADIKKGIYKPVYFLCGEEPFFIDEISNLLEISILSEEERDFNQTTVYGNETDIATVVNNARRYPMMSKYQVVIVREAQNLRNIEQIEGYLSHIQPTTILVIAYKGKTPDKRKKYFKQLNSLSECVYFESEKIKDNKLPEWIVSYCDDRKITISQKAANILSEYLGNDLSRINNEIDKLLITSKSNQIDEKLVEEHTGISKDYNIFELNSAIVHKDVLKSNQIVNYMIANPKNAPLVLIIPTLYKYFLNLLTYYYEKKNTPNDQQIFANIGLNYFQKQDITTGRSHYSAMKCALIISLLREFDMKSKGSTATPDGELLRELVFKILHI